MILTKEQIEAGLKACNHFAESYAEESTPLLYEFILELEKELKELKELTKCLRCNKCKDTGLVERVSEHAEKSVTTYNACTECDQGLIDKRVSEQ